MSLTRRTLAGLIALAPTRAWASEGPLVAAIRAADTPVIDDAIALASFCLA